MNKTESFFKKVKGVSTGLSHVAEGINNYRKPIKEVEDKALDRSKVCVGCPLLINEPIPFLRKEDKRIPSISNKCCSNCGCTAAYLLRQNSKICKKWHQ